MPSRSASSLPARIEARIAERPPADVWTPVDFLDLGPRDAVDKALQRMARAGTLRRVDRGLYDRPRTNALTGRPTVPDYRAVIDALARRDQARMLVDGLTAANDLGLTDAVPSRVVVHTDARRRPVHLGNLVIEFKVAAPSRLYWAGRPAMRVVQALHWLKDLLPAQGPRVLERLRALLADPAHGPALRADLREGLPTLPAWMQRVVRDLLGDGGDSSTQPAAGGDAPAPRARRRPSPERAADPTPAQRRRPSRSRAKGV
jgi:hypothetical protein